MATATDSTTIHHHATALDDAAAGETDDRWPPVAVTGATGFVGSHLVDWLADRGCAVRAICRPVSDTSRLREKGIECRVVDWESPESLAAALDGTGIVFHLAAVTHALRHQAYYRCNTGYCGSLAEACAMLNPVPRLVLCSSIAAAGPTRRANGELGWPAAPVSHYGKSKRGGELAVAMWADQVPITIVRPGIVFGPRNRELLPMFQSIYRYRVHIAPGIRQAPLSWIHVTDLVEILQRAARRGTRLDRKILSAPSNSAPGQGVYHAVAPEHPSYYQFGRQVARSLNRPCAAFGLPHPLPWVGALAGELMAWLTGAAMPLSIDKMREASAGAWYFTEPRLECELRFRFRHPLQERIDETTRWYLEHGWL